MPLMLMGEPGPEMPIPVDEVLWRHQAGPPWPNFGAIKTYVQELGLDPATVHAIEVVSGPGRHPTVRVELMRVPMPPGYEESR